MSIPGSVTSAAFEARFRSALRCPEDGGELAGAALVCARCGAEHPNGEAGTYVLLTEDEGRSAARDFYDAPAAGQHGRAPAEMPAELTEPVRRFLARAGQAALILEIGSGRGAFDGAAPGLVQLDLSSAALAALSGLRVQASAESLPFADGAFDAVFTVAALEHVPDPERALAEIDRVLRPGGSALIYPAWYVRPWASKALNRRALSELGFADRLRKLTIPLRDRREYQFATRLPARLGAELALALGRRLRFRFRRLDPNLEQYLTSDSDAFSSMDPHAASAYFVSRGYRDLNRPSPRSRLAYAYEPVELAKPPAAGDALS